MKDYPLIQRTGRAHRRLRVYQRNALYYSLKNAHSALFLEMRLGKSIITLRNIAIRTRDCTHYRVLIVAPYSALYGWRKELELEGFTSADIVQLTGTKQKRSAIFFASLSLFVKYFLINKEGWRALPEIANIDWDFMVVDESTFLKSPPRVSGRTKADGTSKFFTENFRNVKHRFILTGTPMPESEMDIYMQLKFLDPSILPYKNFWEFRNDCFTQYEPHEYAIKEKSKKYMQNKLAKHCFFLTCKEVNLGGRKIYMQRYVKFTSGIRKIYDNLMNDFILENDSGDVLGTAEFTVAKFIWARRLCGGFVRQLKNEKKFDLIFDAKGKEVFSLLSSELKGKQVVIWCEFTKEIMHLKRILRSEGIACAAIFGSVSIADREKRMNLFYENELQVLICQSKCYQYGTDLSCADTEIYYSSPLGLETRLQSEARLNAVDKNSILIIDLLVEDTIEEDIYESLIRKESRQEMWRRIVQRLQRENNE